MISFLPEGDHPQDVVIAALKSLGGIAHLDEIAGQCDVLGLPQPAPSIRRLLQQFSSDAVWTKARKPQSAPDVFYSLDGVEKRTGFWGLRGFAVSAPDEYPIVGLARAYATLLPRSKTALANVRGIAYRKGSVQAVQVSFAPGSPYPDRLLPDGRIEHIGEGRGRVQEDKGGNLGMRIAIEEGHGIAVYQSVGPKGSKRYAPLGLYLAVGSERRSLRVTGNDFDTSAFVFTLEPVGNSHTQDIETRIMAVNQEWQTASEIASLASTTTVQDVPVEVQSVEKLVVRTKSEAREVERREQRLVLQLKAFLESKGFTVTRKRIVPAGESNHLLTDLYIKEPNLLIEAKGTVDRVAFRMAIGQLADYRRYMDRPRSAILVPSKPRLGLIQLAEVENVSIIWPSSDGFESTRDAW